MQKIFIDPGHGGSDPGVTANGLKEKDLCLTIALKLRNILNQEYEGHMVKLSRTTDKTLTLKQRINMAIAGVLIILFPYTLTQAEEQILNLIFTTRLIPASLKRTDCVT